MEFFALFGEHADRETVEEYLLPGMYSIPAGCEYCHAEDSKDCNPQTCQRPRLYFHKKRPPFCPPNPSQWDLTTDLQVPAPPPRPEPVERKSSILENWFGSSNGGGGSQ